jgi:hypothetical protein
VRPTMLKDLSMRTAEFSSPPRHSRGYRAVPRCSAGGYAGPMDRRQPLHDDKPDSRAVAGTMEGDISAFQVRRVFAILCHASF